VLCVRQLDERHWLIRIGALRRDLMPRQFPVAFRTDTQDITRRGYEGGCETARDQVMMFEPLRAERERAAHMALTTSTPVPVPRFDAATARVPIDCGFALRRHALFDLWRRLREGPMLTHTNTPDPRSESQPSH